MARAGYTSIPGSRALRTRKRGSSALEPVLSAARTTMTRVTVDVDGRSWTVGRALVQGESIPLLVDVVDRVAPLLEPEEFAVYLQLYRLAVGADRNVCRCSRAELSRRTRLQDRRLGKAIAGLVQKGHVVLVDRDRDGTLYRVCLPSESLDGPPAPAPAKATRPAPTPPARPPASDTTLTDTTTTDTTTAPTTTTEPEPVKPATAHAPTTFAPRSVGDVCAWFTARHGTTRGRTGTDVAAVVLELLENGHTFSRIPALLDAFVARAPKATPLRDLPRVLGLDDERGAGGGDHV